MKYNHRALGNRLYQFRKAQNLSQKQLSDLSGVSKGYISNIELGNGKTISFEKLEALAKALNVNLDDLVFDSLLKYQHNNGTGLKSKIISELKTCTSKERELFYASANNLLEMKGKSVK